MPDDESSGVSLQRLCALAVVVLAALVLTGWTLDAAALKSVLPGAVAMNPLTALLFLAAGLVFIRRGPEASRFAAPVGGVLGAVGLLRLLSLTGWDLGLDTLLFRRALEAYPVPNRIAPNTAFGFVMAGAALVFLPRPGPRTANAGQSFALGGLSLALFALLGYAYRVPRFYGVGAFIPMALNTALCFGLLNAAVLLARRREGWMACLSDDGPGGAMARGLLPFTFAVPALAGFLCLQGQWSGRYSPEVGTALFALALVAILSWLVWYNAALIGRVELARQQAEEALRRHSESLAQANQELDAFCYSVSHDLRAPLRGIDGFSQAILEDCGDKLDPTSSDHLNRIRKGAQRMAELIDGLLTLSRLTRAELKRSRVPLSELAATVARTLADGDAARTVRFTGAPGLETDGDPNLLRIVLENLLGNAWKYTSKRPEAVVEFGAAPKPDGSSAFFVRDNGAGFDMALSGKLFGAFQRLHSDREFPGYGIGLATVARIVHRHGGKIWAEAAVDKGATFYFTL